MVRVRVNRRTKKVMDIIKEYNLIEIKFTRKRSTWGSLSYEFDTSEPFSYLERFGVDDKIFYFFY